MIHRSDREFLPLKKAAALCLLKKSRGYELRQNQQFPAVEEEIWGYRRLRVPTVRLLGYIQDLIEEREEKRRILKQEISQLKENHRWLKELYYG